MPELVDPDCEPCQIDHDCATEPDECWHTPKWWTCRYWQTANRSDMPTESCSFGCYDEPNCVTGQPTEGWPVEVSDA